ADAEQLGLTPIVLGAPGGHRGPAPALSSLQAPGIVLFTSGTTGSPRPVYRSLAGLLAVSAARIRALALRPGAGILMGVSFASGQGLNLLLASMLLGGSIGLLEPLDHRAALEALARPEFHCWRATPHFADVLGRCALTRPAVAPPLCILSSPVSKSVFDAFRA